MLVFFDESNIPGKNYEGVNQLVAYDSPLEEG